MVLAYLTFLCRSQRATTWEGGHATSLFVLARQRRLSAEYSVPTEHSMLEYRRACLMCCRRGSSTQGELSSLPVRSKMRHGHDQALSASDDDDDNRTACISSGRVTTASGGYWRLLADGSAGRISPFCGKKADIRIQWRKFLGLVCREKQGSCQMLRAVTCRLHGVRQPLASSLDDCTVALG